MNNADGSPADLSGFIGGTNQLIIVDSAFDSPPVLVTSLTIVPNTSVARWIMGSSDTDYFGTFVAVLTFKDPANSVFRQTKPLTVYVYPRAPTS